MSLQKSALSFLWCSTQTSLRVLAFSAPATSCFWFRPGVTTFRWLPVRGVPFLRAGARESRYAETLRTRPVSH